MLTTPMLEPHARRWLRARGNAPFVPAEQAPETPGCVRSPGMHPARLKRPAAGSVHVWQIDLRDMGADAVSLLDAAEIGRAQRFVYAHDWRRYVAAHAWLRRILGAYMGVAPQDLRLAIGAHGKPMLAQQHLHDGPQLHFNMSHSKDLALIAVTSGLEVGVDIEAIRGDLPGPDLAVGVLTSSELEALDKCDPENLAATFVGCWTRKEACLKALGVGLGLEPRNLCVGLPAQRMTLQRGDGEDPVDLAPLPCPHGYAAALAVIGAFARIERQDPMQIWEGAP